MACAAVVSAPLGACSVNPATGQRQFDNLSTAEEIRLGEEATPQLIEGYGGEVSSQPLRSYVSTIGMDLAQYTEADYPNLPWEFYFLDSEVVNAFALPGGKVFVTRGLVEKMNNEAQLAGVIGHEIGHVTAEHADQQMTRQMLLGVGAAIAGAAASAAGDDNRQWAELAVQAAVTGAGVYALTFSREQELEADKLGMRYMTRAGYNPIGLRQVMEIFLSLGGPRGPEFFSTHPAPETRIDRINERLSTNKYRRMVNDPNFGLFEQRFQRQMLQPLSMLPPANHGPREAVETEFALAHPHLWCAHCAHARASAQR